MVDVILGLQWGDEGKGKIVDVFTPGYEVIARFQGGPNAGHTIEFDGRKFILHTIPSGIFHPGKQNVIGNGVLVDPFILFREIDQLHAANLKPEDNLLISLRAHLILPTHRLLDAAYEWAKGSSRIGSTLKGISPAYTDKYARNGLRTGIILHQDFPDAYNALKNRHLKLLSDCGFDHREYRIDGLLFPEYEKGWLEAASRLKEYRFTDSEYYLNRCLDEGKPVLAEGSQGAMLDIDFGSYPYVTSSSTIAAGACSGLGISPRRIGRIHGVFKAYCTRVGGGPFPTELTGETGDLLRTRGHEFGSTTGRPLRCVWLDLAALRYAIMLNGVDRLIMMKADVLNTLESIYVGTGYRTESGLTDRVPFDLERQEIRPVLEKLPGWNASLENIPGYTDLPVQLKDYISTIEKATGLPVELISTGPDRIQTIRRNPS